MSHVGTTHGMVRGQELAAVCERNVVEIGRCTLTRQDTEDSSASGRLS